MLMKYLSAIVLMLGMAVAGYVLYDGVIAVLQKKGTIADTTTEDPLIRTIEYSLEHGEKREIKVNLHTLSPKSYPDTCVLRQEISLTSLDGAITQTIPKGTKLIPRNVKNGQLVVSEPKSDMEGLIDFEASDFETRLAKRLSGGKREPSKDENVAEKTKPAIAKTTEPALEKEPTQPIPPPDKPMSPPAPSPSAPSTPLVQSETHEAKENPSTPLAPTTPSPPAPLPAPEKETAKDSALTAPTGKDTVVSAMQKSIKEKQIAQFKFEQVTEWKAGAKETIDGTIYSTGIASFESNTIFGPETLTAKALIRDGAVVKWVWPRSGMEIR